MNNTSVLTTGALAHGSVAQAGGRIIGDNTSITTQGNLGSALFLIGTPDAISSGTFTSSTLINKSGPTIGIAGSGDASLTNSHAEGSGQWLFVGTETDFFPLAAIEPPQYGSPDPNHPDAPPPSLASFFASPGLGNITLINSTVVGSAFTAVGSVSNLTMQNNSLWTMTANSNITNLRNEESTIAYTAPTSDAYLLQNYKTLTAVNYVGDKGFISLNTFLGTDGSPSDRLIIDAGTADGLTGLSIYNTIGQGELTLGNGILVVEALNAGQTSPAAFYLSTPVLAGPFEYSLYRSSLDNSGVENWYLRNICPPSNPNCSPEPPPPPYFPIIPPTQPHYRSEVGLYPVLPAMTLLYGQTLVDTLHQRVGQGKWPDAPITEQDTAQRIWSRMIGLHGERNRLNNQQVIKSSNYDYNFGLMQIGGDLFKREKENGQRDHVGIYGAFGRASGSVERPGLYLGDNQFTALSLGGYWTLYSAKEAYIDTVLQATRYYDVISHSYRLLPLKTEGWGFVGSLEGGYPFIIKPNWILEPQLQGVYETVDLRNGRDIGAVIQFRDTEAVVGRIGARLAHKRLLDELRVITTWFRPNLWHQFKGTPTAGFSSAYGFIPFRSELEGSTLELNLGSTLDLPNNLSLYANGSYGVGLNMHMNSYDGRIGFKVKLT